MKKKLTAIFTALIIAVSLLPLPAMAAVSADEETRTTAAVKKVITDYAAKVYQPNSDDESFNLFLKHGFYGNHKDLVLDESSPMVSSLFNACLMQEALITGISKSIVKMQNFKLDTVYVRSSPAWHNYNYTISGNIYLNEEPSPAEYLNFPMFVPKYTGLTNEHDDVMELLVGSSNVDYTIREAERKDGTVVYDLELNINDRFDFTTDYDKVKEKGYDASTDQDLVNLGYLLTFVGLDEFDWSFKKTLQVEVPIHCDHGSYNYHWTFDGDTLSMISEDGSGFTMNPATVKEHPYKDGNGQMQSRLYHELREAVVLRHDRPWVLELDQTNLRYLQFCAQKTNTHTVFPTIYAMGQEYFYLYFYEFDTNEKQTTYTHHYVGVKTLGAFDYNPKHSYTYTMENKVSTDGSNMIYLTITDNDLGEIVLGPTPMDDHWRKKEKEEERTLISTESDMAVGRDIIINYLGTTSVGIGSASTVMDLRVWENGKDAVPDTGTYTAPTCTDAGGYLHHCHKCGNDYLTNAEAALGHDFGDYMDDHNTTCTTDGTKTRTCERCELKDTVTIEGSALGHSYSEYTDDGNTTCTVDGTETRTCAACGNTETRTMEGSAQGHKYGAYQFDHNSTCTADGTLTAVCSACGEKDVIPAEGSATGHNHKATVTAPTCTEQGYTTYTCHCGDTYVDDYVDPIPHAEVVIPAIPSTCVEKGKTEGKQCEICGEITVPQTPTAYGNHTWDAGTVIKQPTPTEPGTLMYTCVNCSKTTHMSITEMPSTGFDDVPADAYYAAAVAWAKENGITSGLSETLFGDHMSCTRGQVVTFLWAAAGRPEPKTSSNPFTDVTESDYFYKPVLWAVENGITGGIGDGLFGPNETCTRGQIVTFLWASQGKPQSGSSTFIDVADTDWYAKSVVWAAENGVTGGIGNNQFGPNNICTRAQVVTFLYKVYG